MQSSVKSCLVLAINLLAIELCFSHPTGAPASACDDLRPQHGSAQPQTSDSPYKLVGHPINESQIHLIIETADNSAFRGFLIQARRVNGSEEPIGKFVPLSDNAKTLNCLNGNENTITHSNRKDKPKVTILWSAPKHLEDGTQIVFTGTVLKNAKTFWSNLHSEPIKVSAVRAMDGNGIDDQNHNNKDQGFGHNSSKVQNSSVNNSADYLLVSAALILFYRKL